MGAAAARARSSAQKARGDGARREAAAHRRDRLVLAEELLEALTARPVIVAARDDHRLDVRAHLLQLLEHVGLDLDAKVVAVRDRRLLETEPHLNRAELRGGDGGLLANQAAQLGHLRVHATLGCLNSRPHRRVHGLERLRGKVGAEEVGDAARVRRQSVNRRLALLNHRLNHRVRHGGVRLLGNRARGKKEKATSAFWMSARLLHVSQASRCKKRGRGQQGRVVRSQGACQIPPRPPALDEALRPARV